MKGQNQESFANREVLSMCSWWLDCRCPSFGLLFSFSYSWVAFITGQAGLKVLHHSNISPCPARKCFHIPTRLLSGRGGTSNPSRSFKTYPLTTAPDGLSSSKTNYCRGKPWALFFIFHLLPDGGLQVLSLWFSPLFIHTCSLEAALWVQLSFTPHLLVPSGVDWKRGGRLRENWESRRGVFCSVGPAVGKVEEVRGLPTLRNHLVSLRDGDTSGVHLSLFSSGPVDWHHTGHAELENTGHFSWGWQPSHHHRAVTCHLRPVRLPVMDLPSLLFSQRPKGI